MELSSGKECELGMFIQLVMMVLNRFYIYLACSHSQVAVNRNFTCTLHGTSGILTRKFYDWRAWEKSIDIQKKQQYQFA